MVWKRADLVVVWCSSPTFPFPPTCPSQPARLIPPPPLLTPAPLVPPPPYSRSYSRFSDSYSRFFYPHSPHCCNDDDSTVRLVRSVQESEPQLKLSITNYRGCSSNPRESRALPAQQTTHPSRQRWESRTLPATLRTVHSLKTYERRECN